MIENGIRFDEYKFEWFDNGDVTVTLLANGSVLTAFNIDGNDRDNFLKLFSQSCKDAKKTERKARRG